MVINNIEVSEQGLPFLEYINIPCRHWFLIVLVLTMVVSIAFLFLFSTQPVHESSVTLVIDQDLSRSALTGERLSYDTHFAQSLTFKTHFQMIKSRSVMTRVIQELDLERFDKERGLETARITRSISQIIKAKINFLKAPILSKQEKLVILLEKLRKKISVNNIKSTRLLKISVQDNDPDMALKIANTIASIYIEFDIASRLKYPLKRLSLMEKQLNAIKEKLEKAEKAFLNYKDKNNIFSIEGKQKIISQKINEFNDVYVTTRNKRFEFEVKLNQFNKLRKKDPEAKNEHFRSLINNPHIDLLYNQVLNAEIELARISKVFLSKHSKVIQIQTEIENIRKKISQEIVKELDNMKAELTVFKTREKIMLKTIDEFERDAKNLNKNALGYLMHQREVETNKDLYYTLLSKMKQESTTGNIEVSNIRISQKAETLADPIWPNKKMIIILSVAFGILSGIGLAFIIEYFTKALHTDNDVENKLGLSVLSVIPRFKKTWVRTIKKSVQSHDQILDEYLSNPTILEPYRYLIANLDFIFSENKRHILVISSPGSKEGKTFTSVNLAHTIARSATTSVLIIDADIHNPELSQLFGLSKTPGLAELLSDSGKNINDYSEMLFKIDPSLYILPIGNHKVFQGNFLHSETIALLLTALKQKFDHIIIDAPPILFSTDTVILGSHADGLVIVFRACITRQADAKKTLHKLRLCRTVQMGAVINQG